MAPFSSFIFIALALASHSVFGAPSASKCSAKWYHHHTISYAPSASPVETSPPATQSNPSSTPASSPSNTASPSPSPSSSSGSVSSSDIDAYLTNHNDFRKLHGADPLTWNDTLSATALTWGEGCKFKHSGGPYGENIAAGTGDFTIANAIKMWTDESKDYNPSNPVASHFTQVVWKATTQLGCAKVRCGSGTIFPAQDGPATYVVCEYSPPGNVDGYYAQNVQV